MFTKNKVIDHLLKMKAIIRNIALSEIDKLKLLEYRLDEILESKDPNDKESESSDQSGNENTSNLFSDNNSDEFTKNKCPICHKTFSSNVSTIFMSRFWQYYAVKDYFVFHFTVEILYLSYLGRVDA